MSRLKVAVVGAGHLGRIHARLLVEMSDVELVGIADPLPTARDKAAADCGAAPFAGAAAGLTLFAGMGAAFHAKPVVAAAARKSSVRFDIGTSRMCTTRRGPWRPAASLDSVRRMP